MSELAKMRAMAAVEFDKKFPPPSLELPGDEYDALEEQRKIEFVAWWSAWQHMAALASPADALVAGDSEIARDAERLNWLDGEDFVSLNQYIQIYSDDGTPLETPRKFFAVEAETSMTPFEGNTSREAIDAAIQAQKDGHG